MFRVIMVVGGALSHTLVLLPSFLFVCLTVVVHLQTDSFVYTPVVVCMMEVCPLFKFDIVCVYGYGWYS